MKLRAVFQIKTFENRSGELSFRVTGTKHDGSRIRENFSNEFAALTRQQQLEIEATNVRTEIATQLKATRLSDSQIMEAERAFAELGDRSLIKAVRFFLENFREPVRPITIAAAFDLFIADKTRQNCRPDSITSLRRKNASLLKTYGGRNVSEILPDHVKEIAFRAGLSPVSQDNVRRALVCFFNWAVEQGYCQESPLAKIKAVKIERDEPQVLPLSAIRKLLFTAASYKKGVVLPFVAISLFAAVRPKELERLTWDDVNLEHNTITIQGKGAKMRERRIIELSDNLVAWLKPHSLARQPFVGKNWRRDFDAVKRLAGYGGRTVKPTAKQEDADPQGTPQMQTPAKEQTKKPQPQSLPWVPDIMRHTAISMHLAQHQHEGRTATWAGNTPLKRQVRL